MCGCLRDRVADRVEAEKVSVEEKQIEELARVICDGCTECKRIMCTEWYIAQKIYNAGYRKHVEGEWKETCVKDVFQCTNCKRPTKMDELCDSEILRAYCPNCGARMR